MPNRATDFRHIFASTIGFAWSDNDCRLTFGIDEGNGPEEAFEQISINMTHRTAKLLAHHLNAIIEHYETSRNIEIPLNEEKVQSLKDMMDANNPPI